MLKCLHSFCIVNTLICQQLHYPYLIANNIKSPLAALRVLQLVMAGDITVPKGADLLLVQSFNASSDAYFSLPERFWPEVSYMLKSSKHPLVTPLLWLTQATTVTRCCCTVRGCVLLPNRITVRTLSV
jgi:hypothetical protein